MSEEIKKTQPEPVEQPVELAEQELDQVAGGKQIPWPTPMPVLLRVRAPLFGHNFPSGTNSL